MSFLSTINELNPLTFSRKSRASRNIWLAAYTFQELTTDEQDQVKRKVEEIESQVKRRFVTFCEVMERCSSAQKYLFFALAMNNLGIFPALGNQFWAPCKNPYADSYGAEHHILIMRSMIETEFGVKLLNLDAYEI